MDRSGFEIGTAATMKLLHVVTEFHGIDHPAKRGPPAPPRCAPTRNGAAIAPNRL
jgi:hypothetical protein